jgi:hypothetical protein
VNPVAGSNNKDTCVYVTSSNCVIWNGPDLQCIDLCKGDTVSDVTAKVAATLCTYIEDNKLDDLDLKCVFDACLGCPAPDKSLKTVLELIINKVCSLDTIITECCNGGNGTVDPGTFDVNLKCLAITDGSGTILNNDNNDEIVQTIIDRICNHETRLQTVEATVDDLQDQINNIDVTGGTIPLVSSACLYSGAKPINEAFLYLDTSFCSFKTAFGNEQQVVQALAQQCSSFYQVMTGNPNVVTNPTTLAQSMKNLWLLTCNLLDRINSIESNCCKPTCDDLKVGYQVVFNEDQTINLKFTTGSGTSIPSGFTDCGSFVIISDAHGHQVTADNLNIAMNAITYDIDIQELTPGDILSFDMTVKMCQSGSGPHSSAIVCEKCVYKTVTYPLNVSTACEVCEICATAGTGDITIDYINENTLVAGTITILTGTCANVYNYMVVQSIAQTGVGVIDNINCLNFPNV